MIQSQPRTTLTWTPPRALLAAMLACLAFSASAARAQDRVQVQPPSPEALGEALAALRISQPGVRVSAVPSRQRSAADELPFTRQQASDIGIDVMALLEPIDFLPPIWNGRGLSAGDVDRDGYLDLLVATKRGVRLFMNQAGVAFQERQLAIPEIRDFETHVVALVDINNDGWLDIFMTTYQTGIHYILSQRGEFKSEALVKAPEHPTVVAQAASFGDIDEDGDLDLVVGNYYLGRAKLTPPEDSTNKVLIFDKGKFRVTALREAIVGDTHSILLSDFNHDGHLDLIVGNDFRPPDYFYLGDGKGGFEVIKRSDGIIPISTNTTMSVDTADYNNDLQLDLLLTQIAAAATGPSVQLRLRPLKEYCHDLSRIKDRFACELALQQKMLFRFFSKMQPSDILRCRAIVDPEHAQQCAAMMLWLVAHREKDQALCERMPEAQQRALFYCHALFTPAKRGTDEQYAESIAIVKNENTLLRATGDGRFENVARAVGVATTGFSWNSKFADFDNDGWQDLYVVNGTWAKTTGTPQKFFFHNLGGERFEEVTDAFGLQNYMFQSAYLTIDFDNDGDLDVIANTISGPIWFYKNNDRTNNAIIFEMRDEEGNRYCIGCKLRIYLEPEASASEASGPEGVRAQLREIKSGGGYLSFDAAFAHFGLGSETSVARVEIDWSTGGTTRIQGPFPANARYTIRREGIQTDSP